ncbi:MAG: sigma-54-dependent Fis family transcriptional regulator [Planctomycetota bacterium]|nr:sigma-54-dependent Fis family transcriptional regulator [Planctomycetota bacterium]
MKKQVVVLVDDSPEILELESDALAETDADILPFSNPLDAWQRIQRGDVSLVVTDWEMPQITGLDLLFKIQGLPIRPAVIFLTGCGTVHRAVQAMMQGAQDFLEKPFEPGDLQKIVERSLARCEPVDKPARPPRAPVASPEEVVASPKMREVFALAKTAAKSESSVLLLGESGTGKEVLADFIHRHSRRATQPCIKVNCGALPENLVESELFGHEKGAFTGADKRRVGRFEQANGGTLFLDEIGDLPLPMQVKLLRALQDKLIQRVGGEAPVPSNFRLVSATNQHLPDAVAGNAFREDLYYRINVVQIVLPSLRERPEDIEPLAHYFVSTISREMSLESKTISPAAIAMLKGYAWPGNVRQLRNAVEFGLIMSKGSEIQPAELPADLRQAAPVPAKPAAAPASHEGNGGPPQSLEDALRQEERNLIERSLDRHNWEIEKVMEELKVSRSRLYDRIKAFGLKRP